MTMKDEEREVLTARLMRLVGYDRLHHSWARFPKELERTFSNLSEAMHELFLLEDLLSAEELAEQFVMTDKETERALTEVGLRYVMAEEDGTLSKGVTLLGEDYVGLRYIDGRILWKESVVPLISSCKINTCEAADDERKE